MKHSSYMKRSKPVCVRNHKRYRSERERQFGDLAEWVASLPCDNCGRVDGVAPAHVTGRRRAGAWIDLPDGTKVGNILPLCDDPFAGGCHFRQHQSGWSALAAIGSLAVAKERARRYGEEFRGGEAASREARPPA